MQNIRPKWNINDLANSMEQSLWEANSFSPSEESFMKPGFSSTHLQ